MEDGGNRGFQQEELCECGQGGWEPHLQLD